MYLIRLDDASEKRDILRWDRVEALLDKYGIKPLVGVIPHNEDEMFMGYDSDDNFWERVKSWRDKGWEIALHGYSHCFVTNEGGIHPVNDRSEFAGVPFEEQVKKIADGMEIFRANGVEPKVFFAPAHTFDENTLRALAEASNIRIISDTAANKPYCKYGFTFIPQQSGKVRKLPFHTVTFCYHPNVMQEADFEALEAFIIQYRGKFRNFEAVPTKRRESLVDKLLSKIYFMRRR